MFHLLDLIKELQNDKSIARIIFNWHVEKYCRDMKGTVLDIASGDASYYKYINQSYDKLIRADYDANVRPDIALDFNKSFPFKDNEIDNILFFGSIYIADRPEYTLGECKRVLKPGGAVYINSPFIFNESREPHDYYRFTSEKLEEMLKGAGFSDMQIIPMGERFTAASFLVGKFLFIPALRFILYSSAIFLDKILPDKIK